jgi:nucleoid-associated protein YgaU
MERLDEPPIPVAVTEVTLVPGDHLWATATAALTTAWGRPPSDAEVAPYWDRLVAANRDRLPDPANPDLVLPGLTVVVPPAPPSP